MISYYHSYLRVLKTNFMLLVMAFFLLIPTFFIWAGVPVFIIGGAVVNITSNPILIYLCVSLSVGIIFSLYFLPINLKVAQDIAISKKRSRCNSFMRIEIAWIIIVATIFQIISSALI